MAENPLVSIGLPVYNGERFLIEALESLRVQDYAPLEIVISDNGSTDATPALCRRYASLDGRIRYHRLETNHGAAFNFRRVVELSRGPFFMWASDDDRWSPNYVSVLAARLQAERGCVLCAGRAFFLTPEGEIRAGWGDSAAPSTSEDAALVLLAHHATHWIYGLFDHAWLTSMLPHLMAQPPWGGDLLFLLRVCLTCRITGEPSAILYKRVRPSAFQPSTPRSVVRWRASHARSLLREIAQSPLPLGRKAALLWACLRYLNRSWEIASLSSAELHLRALYHQIRRIDRP
jgi:glycosyltransferase involved in cell wall biosynthesis